MDDLSTLVNINIDNERITHIISAEINKTVDGLLVENQQQYEFAADLIGDISSRIADHDAMRKKLKAPILEAGRNVDNLFRRPLESGREMKEIVKNKMLSYLQVVNEQKKIEEDRAARLAGELKDKAEKEAIELMEKGEDEAAQEVLDNVDLTPVPFNVIEPPKVKGISTRANWKARVTDLHKLVRAVANGTAPITLLMVDMAAANVYAKCVRDSLTVPGLSFYNNVSITAKRKVPYEDANKAF